MKIKQGDTASLTRTIRDSDVRAFADVSGDYNPLHLDEDFAQHSRFGQRIAHGMLSASLISAVIANKLPGEGSIYLAQTLKFVAPVFLGDTVEASVTVIEIREDKSIARLETVCTNQRNEIVIKGEATVFIS